MGGRKGLAKSEGGEEGERNWRIGEGKGGVERRGVERRGVERREAKAQH